MSTDPEELVEVVYAALCGPHSLPTKLRTGGGLDATQLRELCTAMEQLARLYKTRAEVPKRFVYALVDLTCSMQAARARYDEGMQERIEGAADRLVDLAYEIVAA